MRRALRQATAMVGLGLLSVVCAASGCNALNSIGPSCDRSAKTNPLVPYKGGAIDNGIYMSSPWVGELLWFPAGQRYQIHHNLGEVPRFVQIWLSFDACGTKTSTVAQAAGNQAELLGIDASTIEIVNGSCTDYWLLIIAGTGNGEPDAPPDMSDAGMSDAGTSDAGMSDGGEVGTGRCL